MPGGSRESKSQEDIPLPLLNVAKEHDYAQGIETEANFKTSPVDSSSTPSRENAVELSPVDHHSSDSSPTASSDEFDWEAEDDVASQKIAERPVKAKRIGAIWRAFMKLARPVRTLIVALVGGGILIAPLLVFRLRFNSSPARTQAYAWSLWFAITWATACGTYLIVDAIPGLILRVLNVAKFKVQRLQTTIQLMTAISGWLKFALDVSWMWIALSVIRAVIRPPGSYWVIVNRIMQALFTFSLLLLAEKVFLRYIAINFHRKALADRLTENRLGLEALDRLSNVRPTLSKRHPYGAGKKGHKSMGSSLDFLGFGSRHPGGMTSTSSSPIINEKQNLSKNLKLNNAERRERKKKAVASVIVDGISGAIGQVALKDSRFNRQTEMGGLYSAGKLARKLFSALSDVWPPRKHLIVEDFYPYFRTTADAKAAFAIFDKDGNGDISKREMREAVRRIYRERKALIASLKDVSSAVAKLDAVMIGVALLIFIFVCLLIFNRQNTIASLVPLATIILGFSFVFGHSAQTLFESLIFIFSTHVFDVGDLVLIDDSPMFVKEFGLFSTTFRRVDGQEVIAPNSLLANEKLVHNLRRSASMWETTELMVSYDTPLDHIEKLRIKLLAYVAENNREWSNVTVNIDKMQYQNAIHLIVAMEHRPNWQDWGGRWARRTAFMRYLKTVMEELDVTYTMPIQPVLLPRELPPMSPSQGPKLGPPPSPLMRRPPKGSFSAQSLRRASSMRSTDSSGRPIHLRP